LIKRKYKTFINKQLSENPNCNILDIGHGYTANKYANTISDVQDLANFYTNKKFVRILDKKIPF
jgi:hypothetical protein